MKTRLSLLAILLAFTACGNDADEPRKQGEPDTAPDETAGKPKASPQLALAKGLEWLKGRSKDGIWMVNYRGQSMPSPAYTAFAIAPIAASLPKDKRKDDPMVRSALSFLLKAQMEDGSINTGGASKYQNYYTAAAIQAFATVGDPAHASAVAKMRDFILTLQRREEGRIKGGFGYNSAESADLSNAQFAIESLRTAGIPESHPAMKRALAFLERAQNRSENEANKGAGYEMDGKKVVPGNDGSAGYEPGVSKAGMRRLPDGTYIPRGYGSMTYALLKCYLLVGVKPDDVRVKAALCWLGKNYTWDENPGFNDIAKELNQPEAPYWGLYYYYMTAAKALALVGRDTIATPDGPRNWRDDLAAAIVSRQRPDGSWINDKSKRWEEADPQLATCYAVIALQEILGRE